MSQPKARASAVAPDGQLSVRNDGASPNSGDGSVPNGPTENLLLSRLAPAELKAFIEQAERISYSLREVLFENGGEITSVYFPVTAMISLVTVLADGTSIEAITVGYEGVAGLPLFHGVKTAQSKGVCQIKGDAYRLSAADFARLVQTSLTLKAILHRYSQFSQDSIAQSAACNSIHLIEQRCARWLLLSSDAVRNGHFSLTQEFFAQMLAVRRSGVTTALSSLERQNLIATSYGSIKIVDRDGLNAISCECYNAISKRRQDLLN
jgi:CRP-like cAMP-binding protein